MTYLYCGRCDKYTATETIYGGQVEVCGNCGRWAPEIRYCAGCIAQFFAIEEVDGYHSLECKQLADGAWHADLIGG